MALPVDHGRVLTLCPSVADYERELAVVVLPFLDSSSIDVSFAYAGHKLGSIRLDNRVAKLESKINYKAKPAMCVLIRDAQSGECCGCFEIDAVCYLPAPSAASATTSTNLALSYNRLMTTDPSSSNGGSVVFISIYFKGVLVSQISCAPSLFKCVCCGQPAARLPNPACAVYSLLFKQGAIVGQGCSCSGNRICRHIRNDGSVFAGWNELSSSADVGHNNGASTSGCF